MPHTPRLTLIPCGTHTLEAAIAGDEQLAEVIRATVAAGWTEFGVSSIPSTGCAKARKRRDVRPIHRADNRLIGSGGYKGGQQAP
jgi:hypothetical protein